MSIQQNKHEIHLATVVSGHQVQYWTTTLYNTVAAIYGVIHLAMYCHHHTTAVSSNPSTQTKYREAGCCADW